MTSKPSGKESADREGKGAVVKKEYEEMSTSNLVHVRMAVVSLAISIMAVSVCFGPDVCSAASLEWTGAASSSSDIWNDTDVANWTGTDPARVPQAGDIVSINNGDTVDFQSSNFDGVDEYLTHLYLGNKSGSDSAGGLTIGSGYTLQYSGLIGLYGGGSLEVSGSVVPDATARFPSLTCITGDTSLILNTGGSIQIDWDGDVGTHSASGAHQWSINGGTLTQSGQDIDFGNNDDNGSVTVDQTGGGVTYKSPTIHGTATYNLSGTGTFDANGLTLNGGEFNQSGGTVTLGYDLSIDGGTYEVTSGTLDINAGSQSSGLFIASSANQTGALTVHGSASFQLPANRALDIGATSGTGTGTFEMLGVNLDNDKLAVYKTGVLRGYGSIYTDNTSSSYTMNGKVIADGYGTDRTLDLSGANALSITAENTTDKGWYAVNGGKLALPDITVSSGDSTVNWGEADYASDDTIDMINSMQLDFTGVGTGGPLSISLLAADHSDVTSAPAVLQGGPLIGIWDIIDTGSFDFGGGSVDLTLRYDSDLYPMNAANPLQLFHYTDGAWVEITGGYDDTYIWANGVTTFSQFAVGYIPEPSSLLLLGFSAICLWRRRRTGLLLANGGFAPTKV